MDFNVDQQSSHTGKKRLTSNMCWTELTTTIQKKILTVDINRHLNGEKLLMFTSDQNQNQNAKNI